MLIKRSGPRVAMAAMVWATCSLPWASACASSCPLPNQQPMFVVQMFFGQDIAGGKRVSPANWRAFLRRDVTPRFPDGFTVLDAYGQWRDPATAHITHEHAKLIEIATPDTPDARNKVTDIAGLYRARFHQQSVGIVTMPGCAAF